MESPQGVFSFPVLPEIWGLPGNSLVISYYLGASQVFRIFQGIPRKFFREIGLGKQRRDQI
jgi:hypothetical protein